MLLDPYWLCSGYLVFVGAHDLLGAVNPLSLQIMFLCLHIYTFSIRYDNTPLSFLPSRKHRKLHYAPAGLRGGSLMLMGQPFGFGNA